MSQNLISINDLNLDQVKEIFQTAKLFKEKKYHDFLNNTTVLSIFFENSTRTRCSFEIAAKELGADVINFDVNSSSLKKGETIEETARTLNAMRPDFVLVRHNQSGFTKLMAQYLEAHVINCGDGANEHPTQSLLDLYTITEKLGNLSKVKIGICGDIMHSRVARSNIKLLKLFNNAPILIGPTTLLPDNALNCKTYRKLDDIIEELDVIMILRIQQERMDSGLIPSLSEYYKFYGLDEKKFAKTKQNVLIMHPGPFNRGVDISPHLAYHNNSAILDQVANGILIRKSIFTLLKRN